MGKNKLIVNGICRDEGGENANVLRMLNNIKPIIDAVALVDTGSKDDTVQLVKDWLEQTKTPGSIIELEWKEFGPSRTDAIRHAEKVAMEVDPKATWWMAFMDMDDQCSNTNGTGPFELDKSKLGMVDGKRVDRYDVKQMLSSTTWVDRWLARIDPEKKWCWKNKRHEYLTPEGSWNATIAFLGGGYLKRATSGYRSKDPYTFLNDAAVFMKELKDNPGDHRNTFYTAQSYRDSGNADLGLVMYKRRIKLGGWGDEVYNSYLNIIKHRITQGKIDDKTICMMLQAINVCPNRFEIPYYLVRIWRLKQMYALAWNFAKAYVNMPNPTGGLFVDESIYLHGFPEEASLVAYYSGDKKSYVALAKRALSSPTIPEDTRKRIQNGLDLFGKDGAK